MPYVRIAGAIHDFSNAIEVQIFHRKQSRQPEDVAVAKQQIASHELWGGPPRNYLSSDIPKVKAYRNELDLLNDRLTKESGIEFTTAIDPDSYHPKFAYWSRQRAKPEEVREKDGYAKIKVKILFCNQFDPVCVAEDQSKPDD